MWIAPSKVLFFSTRKSAHPLLIPEKLFDLSELKFRIGTVWPNFLGKMYQLYVCLTNRRQFSSLRYIQMTKIRYIQTISVEVFTALCINQKKIDPSAYCKIKCHSLIILLVVIKSRGSLNDKHTHVAGAVAPRTRIGNFFWAMNGKIAWCSTHKNLGVGSFRFQ
jgi:hypothetical protein